MKKLITLLLLFGLYHFPISTTHASEPEAILILENQLACVLPPSPLQTIHRLANEGLIEKKAFFHADSVSYFKVKKAFKVFGMPVSVVSAFDEENTDNNLWYEYFIRAHGTSPGHFIEIVIDWPKDKVKKHIIENKIIKLDLELDSYSFKVEKVVIRCHGGYYRQEDWSKKYELLFSKNK